MENWPRTRRPVFGATPITCLIVITLLYVAPWNAFDQRMQALSDWRIGLGTRNFEGVEGSKYLKSLLKRLVRGEDQTKLEDTGFACDSAIHSIVCIADKLVRIDTLTMTIYTQSNQTTVPEETVVKPYSRQEDGTAMNRTSRVTIVHGNKTPPACRYDHNVPAVIFSSGGFSGNQFHEFNEIIIPLFITTRHFQSSVYFVLVDYKPWFVTKYNRILSQLSQYPVMNMASNRGVHCFPGAVVGLNFHDNLAINSSEIPGGHSMFDFKEFLRKSYNLKIHNVSEIEKPVLILISRQETRVFLNEDEMVAMMEELGFQVHVARPKMMSDLDKVSNKVNSCSVLVGAHGAGLTNELFLPAGAVTVQVTPLGVDWPSKFYFGEPARWMGVQYLEYKIEPEESSLFERYGPDHPVILDPASISAKGYQVGRQVYLIEQNMKINIVRFRETLVQALRLTKQSVPSN